MDFTIGQFCPILKGSKRTNRSSRIFKVPNIMKNIHPESHDVTARCIGCSHEFKTQSTQPEVVVELCSQCHPFFTGAQKFVDTAGRIEKFERKYKKNSSN